MADDNELIQLIDESRATFERAVHRPATEAEKEILAATAYLTYVFGELMVQHIHLTNVVADLADLVEAKEANEEVH